MNNLDAVHVRGKIWQQGESFEHFFFFLFSPYQGKKCQDDTLPIAKQIFSKAQIKSHDHRRKKHSINKYSCPFHPQQKNRCHICLEINNSARLASQILYFSCCTCAMLWFDMPPPTHNTHTHTQTLVLSCQIAAIYNLLSDLFSRADSAASHPNCFAGGMFILDHFTQVYT